MIRHRRKAALSSSGLMGPQPNLSSLGSDASAGRPALARITTWTTGENLEGRAEIKAAVQTAVDFFSQVDLQ